MFYRHDIGGSIDPDLGVPPLTVVLRHGREGQVEETTQVDAIYVGMVTVPNVGDVWFHLDVQRPDSTFWWVRVTSRFGTLNLCRDLPVPPMEEAERGVALTDRSRRRLAASVEAFLLHEFSSLNQHLEDEIHGHPT